MPTKKKKKPTGRPKATGRLKPKEKRDPKPSESVQPETLQNSQEESTQNPSHSPKIKHSDGVKVAVPETVEATTVLLFDGLWYDAFFQIKDGKVAEVTIGPGDAQQMSIERSVSRLVSFAERQRDPLR